MTQPYLFEIEAPSRAACPRSARQGAAVTEVGAVAASSPGPWTLVINAPAITVTVRDPKTKAKTRRPAPGWLTMNGRLYWRKRAEIVADWRTATTLVARSAGLPRSRVKRARFDVVLRFTRGNRRDPINWHPTAKAVLDALTAGTAKHPGYGFLPDDAPQFLHCQDCPHLRIGEPLGVAPFGSLGQLVVTITDLSAEAGEPTRTSIKETTS
jgi:hypothetical protein